MMKKIVSVEIIRSLKTRADETSTIPNYHGDPVDCFHFKNETIKHTLISEFSTGKLSRIEEEGVRIIPHFVDPSVFTQELPENSAFSKSTFKDVLDETKRKHTTAPATNLSEKLKSFVLPTIKELYTVKHFIGKVQAKMNRFIQGDAMCIHDDHLTPDEVDAYIKVLQSSKNTQPKLLGDITGIILLSDRYSGGNVPFDDIPALNQGHTLSKGTLILFPSSYLHAIEKVGAGVRDSLVFRVTTHDALPHLNEEDIIRLEHVHVSDIVFQLNEQGSLINPELMEAFTSVRKSG